MDDGKYHVLHIDGFVHVRKAGESEQSPSGEIAGERPTLAVPGIHRVLERSVAHRHEEGVGHGVGPELEGRPSAREISDYLLGELRKITGEEEPDLRVVLPERDEDQSAGDGEYNVFND